MKKTFITLLALAGVVGAASVDCNQYTELGLTSNLVGAYNFTTGGATTGSLGITDFTVSNGVATLGGSNAKPGSSSLTLGNATDNSWTISFDLVSMTGNDDWDNLLVMYSDTTSLGQGYTKSLTLSLNESNRLRVTSDNGGETPFNENEKCTLYTYIYDSDATGENVTYASGQTITLVQDGTAKTLTLYVDGKQTGQVTEWKAASVKGMQFGSSLNNDWGERDPLNSASIDKLAIWSTALTGTQVKSLIVPEPTTATLSLLALAGLCARRRRK